MISFIKNLILKILFFIKKIVGLSDRGSKFVLDQESVEFMLKARQQTGTISQLQEILTAPRDFAKRYSLNISSNVEKRFLKLGEINKAKNFAADDKVNIELFSFFNRVVIDGRYIREWLTAPRGVAENLEIEVPPEVHERIEEMNFQEMIDTSFITDPGQINQSIAWIVVGIIVIVLVFWPSCSAYNFTDVIADPNALDKV